MRKKRIIPQIIHIRSRTKTVRASKEILNSCNCLWQHSIETRKLNPPLDRKIQRRALDSEILGIEDELLVGKN
jgi:hypothetical protein